MFSVRPSGFTVLANHRHRSSAAATWKALLLSSLPERILEKAKTLACWLVRVNSMSA
jgi:hypothetical protein